MHVDPVDAFAVGGIGEPRLQPLGIALGLAQAFGGGERLFLGLDHRQLLAAVNQHVIGNVLLAAPPAADQPPRRNHLAPHPAAVFHAPAGRAQGRVDQLGAGFGFIQRASPQFASVRRSTRAVPVSLPVK